MAIEFEKFKLAQHWFDNDYIQQLRSLLPKGLAWVFDRFFLSNVVQDVIDGDEEWQDVISGTEVQDVINSVEADGHLLTRLLSCFATELARIEGEAWRLLNETDPGVAEDLLEDWERVLGLPEDCFKDQPTTLEERQRQAHAKLFDTYKTTNEQYYIDYAASLGFDITINQIPIESSPRIVGLARMGETQPRMGGRSGYSILEITINSGSSDSALLKCAFNKLKQAHVIIMWIEP